VDLVEKLHFFFGGFGGRGKVFRGNVFWRFLEKMAATGPGGKRGGPTRVGKNWIDDCGGPPAYWSAKRAAKNSLGGQKSFRGSRTPGKPKAGWHLQRGGGDRGRCYFLAAFEMGGAESQQRKGFTPLPVDKRRRVAGKKDFSFRPTKGVGRVGAKGEGKGPEKIRKPRKGGKRAGTRRKKISCRVLVGAGGGDPWPAKRGDRPPSMGTRGPGRGAYFGRLSEIGLSGRREPKDGPKGKVGEVASEEDLIGGGKQFSMEGGDQGGRGTSPGVGRLTKVDVFTGGAKKKKNKTHKKNKKNKTKTKKKKQQHKKNEKK